MEALPVELALYIFDYLNPQKRYVKVILSLINRQFREIVSRYVVEDKFNVCASIACNGYLDLLMWARSSKFVWDSQTCNQAATYGHSHVLKWAYDNGCDFDSETAICIAKHGDIDELKWALDNGCVYNRRIYDIAVENGHTQMCKWLISQGYKRSSGLMNLILPGAQDVYLGGNLIYSGCHDLQRLLIAEDEE